MIKFMIYINLCLIRKNFKNKFLIRNNRFIGGEEVIKFEREFSKFTGQYCISVALVQMFYTWH